jgi:nucleotide-binding universal stress UspA family protein
MFKDLLVATTDEGDDAAAFAVAGALAEADRAHVAVLVHVRVPMPPVRGVLGSSALEGYFAWRDQVLQQGGEHCARWREALRRSGLPGEVRLAHDPQSGLPVSAALQARYADLALVGLGGAGSLPDSVHELVAVLLSDSGRPVILGPAQARPLDCARIVIGWQPSAHCVRAVHEALPLLERAQAVDLVCIDPRRGEEGHGQEPGADLALHLARHGVQVTVHVESGAGDEPGAVLLRRARELGAGLLVVGGYSHSRLREWAVGGTTRHLLTHATVPVLMAH